MANSFPTVPSDLQLVSITYMLNFNGPVGGGVPVGSNLTFTGVTTNTIGALGALGGSGGIQFTFDTPGSFGSFDQTAAETALAGVIQGVFSLMSVITGESISSFASELSVIRQWYWTDGSGNTATYADTMPLPSAS